jgi:hypothetical protein
MSLILKKKPFVPPPEGIWPGCCVDVVDLGDVETPWGVKHHVKVIWEISPVMPETGKRFLASKRYNFSFDDRSTLYKDLRSWRGRAFTAEELKGFDLEKVLAAPCQLIITHEESDGVVYGNVTTVLKADPKNLLRPSGEYKRVKDREGYQPPATTEKEPEQTGADNQPPADDHVPF